VSPTRSRSQAAISLRIRTAMRKPCAPVRRDHLQGLRVRAAPVPRQHASERSNALLQMELEEWSGEWNTRCDGEGTDTRFRPRRTSPISGSREGGEGRCCARFPQSQR
jgi:hypothetical protein